VGIFLILSIFFSNKSTNWINKAGLFEGDIALDSRGLGQLTTTSNKFPNGMVPYKIDLDTGYSEYYFQNKTPYIFDTFSTFLMSG